MSERADVRVRNGSYDRYHEVNEVAGSEYFIDFSALGQAIRRDIWRVVAILILCIGCATYYAVFLTTPIYRATAALILDAADTDLAELLGESGAAQLSETELNTNISVLLSDAQLKNVIERLDLLEDPEFNPWSVQNLEILAGAEQRRYQESLSNLVAGNLRRSIFVRNIQKTFVVTISVTTSSPMKSQRIANAMVDAYLELQVKQKREVAESTTDWLSKRVIELQRDVIEAERMIDDFGSGSASDTVQEGVTLRALVERSRAVDKQYQFFLNRLAEAAAQEGIHRPDGRVMSYASAPLRPIAPRKRLIIFAGFMIGLTLSFGLVSYRLYISDKIRAMRDLENISSAPVLGLLPNISKSKTGVKKGQLFKGQSRLYKAGIEQLLGNLLMIGQGRKGLLYTVTSSNEGDGKTTSIQSLAQGYAESGRSVLLIDGDLRKRSLTRQLHSEDHQGLVALCEGKATHTECVTPTQNSNIYFLGCEKTITQPIDLIYSRSFHDALEKFKDKFDVVLVDTSPILANVDFAALREKNDGTIFIIHENKTTAKQFSNALNKLNRHDIEINGLIITNVDKRSLSNWQLVTY